MEETLEKIQRYSEKMYELENKQEHKLFYQPFITFRSKFNPLRYILGKTKVIWGVKAVDYWVSKMDLDTKDIKIIPKS